jgi:hypothetical protein
MSLTVSVVITCHNYGRYLRECLESILAQERPADEILVVDDASTDETPAIVAEYADHGVRYERVDYHDACRSYNHGIAASSGDLIAYVDADNSLTPRFIGTLAARLEADPALAFAYSDRYWSGEATVAAWQEIGAAPGRVERSYPPDPAMLAHRNFIDTMAIVRRAVAIAVGGFRTLPALWDYRFWITVLEAGHTGCYVPEPLYYYRLHASNMVLTTRSQHRGLILQIRREHFAHPFWAPYIRPELAFESAVVPGQPLPGGTPCTLLFTPQVLGAAYPAAARLSLALPPGVEYLSGQGDRDDIGVTSGGSGVTVEIPYPVPDGAAAAVAPTVRVDLIVREEGVAAAIAATLEWDDLFGARHRLTEQIALPAVRIVPPLQQPIVPGAIQVILGQFGPGEWISAWAAMPADAPRPSLPLMVSPADEQGTVRVDLRHAPQEYAAIVVQGESLRNQVVLVPQALGSHPEVVVPGLLARGKQVGTRALEQTRRRGNQRR